MNLSEYYPITGQRNCYIISINTYRGFASPRPNAEVDARRLAALIYLPFLDLLFRPTF